jgi:hypothetical protein
MTTPRPLFGAELVDALIQAIGDIEMIRSEIDDFHLASARYDMTSLARQIRALADLADALARDLERPRYDA